MYEILGKMLIVCHLAGKARFYWCTHHKINTFVNHIQYNATEHDGLLSQSSKASQYETLFCYCKPSFINPSLLEDQTISLEKLLEDEAASMVFPLDAKYFDDFPMIHED